MEAWSSAKGLVFRDGGRLESLTFDRFESAAAVDDVMWVVERADAGVTVSRWDDSGPALVRTHALNLESSWGRVAFADRNRAVVRGRQTFEVVTNGAVSRVAVHDASRTPLELPVGRRVLGGGEQPTEVCDEADRCETFRTLEGVSGEGPIVRTSVAERWHVAGQQGSAWVFEGRAWRARSFAGLGQAWTAEVPVVLEPGFVNLNRPQSPAVLLMTAGTNGLEFHRVRLGPDLAAGEAPRRVVAVLHDWLLVAPANSSERLLVPRVW
ncbi:MAG: hypothetical protein SFW67_35215 [Myxococcaceae bacterium]|nr:hypothetical protein [Myxococcaceae bacterium]